MSESMEWSAEAKRRFQLQSYEPRPRIDGVEIVELTRHVDDGGSITELLDVQLAEREVGAVDVGDLELAARRGPEPGGDAGDLVVVEVQARDRPR